MSEPPLASADAPSSSSSGPATIDSPWFWVMLFSIAGLLALVVMQPRFAGRQQQIERKSQVRQEAARLVAGEKPREVTLSEGTRITLQPLLLLLAAVLVVSWFQVLRLQHRRRVGEVS